MNSILSASVEIFASVASGVAVSVGIFSTENNQLLQRLQQTARTGAEWNQFNFGNLQSTFSLQFQLTRQIQMLPLK